LMLVLLYIYSTNIPPIMIINRIYEYQNIVLLLLVSFLVGLRTYQHPYILTKLTLAQQLYMETSVPRSTQIVQETWKVRVLFHLSP
jgi:hypothetical protein